VGTSGCIECHREQTQSWSETKHAHTFTSLPAQYRATSTCLNCHVTGYGERGGYVQGTPVETLQELLDVGCEACHGPGSNHVKVARQLVELDLLAMSSEQIAELENRLRTTTQKSPPEAVCVRCHITPEGHKQHPPYQGQPRRAYAGRSPATFFHSVAASSRGLDVGEEATPPPGQVYTGTKRCAACHYPQYQVWRTTPHAVSAAKLPTKYRSDGQCLECHITGHGEPGGYMAGTPARVWQNLLGVTCESCHGPGSEHVRQAKQFIGRGRLSPQAEQMVRATIYATPPGNVCTQCHMQQRHKKHPEFDREQPGLAQEVPRTAAGGNPL
jgi:formate-dependent nitrite reductase cytochrome c552 subunit